MKKLFSLILVLIFVFASAAFAESAQSVRVAALNGPTGMGLVKLMKDSEETREYEFTLAGAPDMIVPKLVKGEIDIAAVPGNLASILYKNTKGNVNVLALNTLGVIYVVERGETVSFFEDLKGRHIYSSGKGSTPEYAFNYLLEKHGIDPVKDLTVDYKSEHAECLSALINDPSAVAVLPQPFVTVAQSKVNDIRIALDFSAEWDKLQEGAENPSGMITGVVIARSEFVKNHPEKVDAFLEKYAESVQYVNENVEEAAKLVGEYGIVAEEVAVKAIPYCNIVCIAGEEMKTKLSGYLEVVYQQNPESVGGQLPGEDFYYVK